VLGGGMSVNFDVLAPGISARLHTAAMRAFRDIAVVPAALGGNSGLIGAAALVFAEARHS
jgi:glucokinase